MFFIDGPDGAGKTTLIEKLREFFPLPFFHSSGPWESKEEGANRLKKALKELFFFGDRFTYLSEYIYGSIFRGGHFLSFDELVETWQCLEYVYLIYVRPSTETLHKNLLKQTVKDHKSQEQIDAVIKKYEQIVKKYDSTLFRLSFHPGMRIIHFNWEETPTEELIQCVGSLLPSDLIKGKLPGPCVPRWDIEG